MFKNNKSILIVCIIALFLLISQVSATEIDSIEPNDFDTTNEFIEFDNSNSNADSVKFNGIDANGNGFDTDSNNSIETIKDSKTLDQETIRNRDPKTLDTETIKSNYSKIDDANPNINYKEYDGEPCIIEEDVKDTSGITMSGDNYSCGPASLATVLNKLGQNLTLKEISQHTNTSLKGTSMQSLIDAARYYNFSAFGVEIDTQSLKENCIVHLNINGNEHWTVISKVTDTHVFLADSTEGNINFSINEFNSYFTKKAIFISNKAQADLKEEIITNEIKILDKSQCMIISGKGMKKKIIGYRTVWKYGMIAKYGWVLRPKVVGGHVSFSQWQYVRGTYYVWGKYKVLEPIYKYCYVSDDALTSAKIKNKKR